MNNTALGAKKQEVAWVMEVNGIRNIAEEIVLKELAYI